MGSPAGLAKNRWRSARQIGAIPIQFPDPGRDLYQGFQILGEARTNFHSQIIVDARREPSPNPTPPKVAIAKTAGPATAASTCSDHLTRRRALVTSDQQPTDRSPMAEAGIPKRIASSTIAKGKVGR